MGETYFINPYHFGTMYPANLEWGEMVDGTTFRPQSATAFTVRVCALFVFTWLILRYSHCPCS